MYLQWFNNKFYLQLTFDGNKLLSLMFEITIVTVLSQWCCYNDITWVAWTL